MARRSEIVECKICDKKVRARGFYGHMRWKHGFFDLKPTQVNGSTPDDSSKLENKNQNSSQKSLVSKFKRTVAVPADQPKILESERALADRMNFKPSFIEYITYYRRNPESAQKEWERLMEIGQKYAWVILINPEKYRALQRVMNHFEF